MLEAQPPVAQAACHRAYCAPPFPNLPVQSIRAVIREHPVSTVCLPLFVSLTLVALGVFGSRQVRRRTLPFACLLPWGWPCRLLLWPQQLTKCPPRQAGAHAWQVGHAFSFLNMQGGQLHESSQQTLALRIASEAADGLYDACHAQST